jgi:hypothetical protein
MGIATLEAGKTEKMVNIFGRFMESISRGLAIQALLELFRKPNIAKGSEPGCSGKQQAMALES